MRNSIVVLLIYLIGCASATSQVTTRAAFDFNCPKEEIETVEIDNRTVGAAGCGQRATFVETCDGLNCTWVLNGTPSHREERFVSKGTGIVHDSHTKLTWQRDAGAREFTFEEGQRYCNALKLDGGGWRLPTKDELLTLVDAKIFSEAPRAGFLSSDRSTGEQVWTVDFAAGRASDSLGIFDRHYVRCAR